MSDKVKPAAKRMVVDPEIQAMAALDNILADLDHDQKQRVLYWLVGRHAGPGFRIDVSDKAAPEDNGRG